MTQTANVTGTQKQLKKQVLRNNEYFGLQPIFDTLYANSKQGMVFTDLMKIITSDENILLAYRNVRINQGSATAGVNKHTITYWDSKSVSEFLTYMKDRFTNYIPHKVRRKSIPKSPGKVRLLGIPTIEDRIFQQCIYQVLEPICEAKFYNHSYGFRPNRSTEHAIAYFMRTINMQHLYHIIDIDIKGFFDNVNHAKLKKQMWSLGIRDKNLISIIGKMLVAEIDGEGIPTKGTPQGGILSPLLSNIVLNELDWWVAGQWMDFPTKTKYSTGNGNHPNHSTRYNAMRRTRLKEMYIVRYADDFKIICSRRINAQKAYHAVVEWLKERLGLEVSPEKSKIVDIRHQSSEFLGFRFKAVKKGKVTTRSTATGELIHKDKPKYVVYSYMTDKAIEKSVMNLQKHSLRMKKKPTIKNVNRYNSAVMGIQNYYRYATHVNKNLSDIDNRVIKRITSGRNKIYSDTGIIDKTYTERYGNYNYKKYYIAHKILYPIGAQKHKSPRSFNQKINNYTIEGRQLVHKSLQNYNFDIIDYLRDNPINGDSVELNNNRIPIYLAQYGKCRITGEELLIGDMELHHIIPRRLQGGDEYHNLMYITYDVHKLLHAVDNDIITKYISIVNPDNDKKLLAKINKYRLLCGNSRI